MFDKVKKMLADFLKVDESKITMDTDIKNDLKADSLVVVEMLFMIEDEMGIIIPDEEVESMTKVGALVKYLEKNAK